MSNFSITKMSVSIFDEMFQLKKFRGVDFHDEAINKDKQNQIIDKILEGLPMAPIVFSQQHVEDRGTVYHVIKGKDKLSSIINFINHEQENKADSRDPLFGDAEKSSAFWKYEFPVIHFYGIQEDEGKIKEILAALEI